MESRHLKLKLSWWRYFSGRSAGKMADIDLKTKGFDLIALVYMDSLNKTISLFSTNVHEG